MNAPSHVHMVYQYPPSKTQSFEASFYIVDDHNYTRAIRMNKEATIEAHLVENSHLEAGSE